MYNMPEFWHANGLNPAFAPKTHNFFIGLPGIALDAWNSGNLTFNDFISRSKDRVVLDFSQAIGRLEEENDFAFDQRLETLSLGFRLKSGTVISASHVQRLHGSVIYPRSLAELLWEGNAGPAFVGQSVALAPSVRTFGWHELRLGLAQAIGPVTLGGRMNLIAGITGVQTDPNRNRISLFTDPDYYQLTVSSDYAFQSANLIQSIDTSGNGFAVAFVDGFNKGSLFAVNGRSFDVGFELQATPRLSFSASVLDLGGRINWDRNAYVFHTGGTYTYEGGIIEGGDLLNGSDIDFDVNLDTFNDIFAFRRSDEAFRSSPPMRYFGSVRYQLTERFGIFGTVFHQQRGLQDQTAVGIGASWNPIKWFTAGAQYGYNNRSGSNLGLHIGCRPGPLQLYIATDYGLAAFRPYASSRANVRAGLSLVFGRRDQADP